MTAEVEFDFDLTEGDVGTDIDIICKDTDGSIIDLTAAISQNYLWQHEGRDLETKLCNVQDASGGVLRYTTQVDDIKPDQLTIWAKIQLPTGTWVSDPIRYTVGPLPT